MRFPILSLDEEMLAPALGYVFDLKCVWPHETMLSILAKFVLANRLPGHPVASQVHAKVVKYVEYLHAIVAAIASSGRRASAMLFKLQILASIFRPPLSQRIVSNAQNWRSIRERELSVLSAQC